MAIDLETLSIKSLQASLKRGDFSVRELVERYREIIIEKNPSINAYLEVFDDLESEAVRVDNAIGNGAELPLAGAPLAIKDNILIEGKQVSAGSKILAGYRASYDATVISRLRHAGAIFLGRTNLDEFAMGSSTENSAFGVTKNPHDLKRVAGGSSGGSAAAVAMGGALGALGSDTGGSIRQPASFCGVVGLKPTYGSVSRSGLIAMGSSLDVIGPFAKSVSDVELLFKVVRGNDPLDSTSLPHGSYGEAHPAPKTIGIPRTLLESGSMDASVKSAFESAEKTFLERGFEIIDIELPHASHALAAYYIVMPAEASSNLARFDGIRYGLSKNGETLLEVYQKTRGEGFGSEVRRRIILGAYVLSAGYYDAYYGRAAALRGYIQNDFTSAFKKVDAIMTPTAPTPAFMIGEKTTDPLAMYLADIFTVTANLAGIPAISLPYGSALQNGSTLPVGIQLMAPHTREDSLFVLGKALLGEE